MQNWIIIIITLWRDKQMKHTGSINPAINNRYDRGGHSRFWLVMRKNNNSVFTINHENYLYTRGTPANWKRKAQLFMCVCVCTAMGKHILVKCLDSRLFFQWKFSPKFPCLPKVENFTINLLPAFYKLTKLPSFSYREAAI